MVDDEIAFEHEIRANPRDPFPRFVYADYLEERGDPRGELIRLQCEIESLPLGPERKARLDRVDELLAEHAEEWLAPLRELGAIGGSARCFRGGLVERVRLPADVFVENVAEICRREPALHAVELKGAHERIDDVAATELPEQVTELDLTANRLEASHVERLVEAEWVERIRVLDLKSNRLGGDGFVALASRPWPRLEELQLASNRIAPGGPVQELEGPWHLVAGLVVLGLGNNRLGPQAVRRLVQATGRLALRELDLSMNRIEDSGCACLGDTDQLPELRTLILRSNGISQDALRRFAQTATFPRLEVLDVRGNGSVPAELAARFGEAMRRAETGARE